MFLLSLVFSGYGLWYDGCYENKHYFQINTPKVDYGIVVSEREVYCDTVFYKK